MTVQDRVITVKCQGCESECEVSVTSMDGKLICLGGNNCPTGEAFALSQAKRASNKEEINE